MPFTFAPPAITRACLCLGALAACLTAPARAQGAQGAQSELVAAQQVPAKAPDSVPSLIEDPSQYVEVDAQAGMSVHRSVFSLEFDDTTSQSTRSAIIASIGGQVVGGEPVPEAGDGPYFVRIADDPTGDSILARAANLAKRPGVAAAYGLVHFSADRSLGYRRPRDDAEWAQREVDPSKMKSARGGSPPTRGRPK